LTQQGLQKALYETKTADMMDTDWFELHDWYVHVLDEMMYHVLDLTSPKEVLDKLESRYLSKTRMNRLFSKLRLYSLKMQEGSDLQHVNTLTT
jgi:hypothetical protein